MVTPESSPERDSEFVTVPREWLEQILDGWGTDDPTSDSQYAFATDPEALVLEMLGGQVIERREPTPAEMTLLSDPRNFGLLA